MEEQVQIITSIITALLTGGFIILFLENQHVGANVMERYHFIMQPFMHRLSNYFNFLSSAKIYFSIKRGVNTRDEDYVIKFKNLMDKLGHYAHPCIMSGQDYPASKFSAKQLQSLCEDINNVWYYWENKRGYMADYCYYDEREANLYCQLGREYLNEIFPHKYEKEKLSLDLISNVSGTFYTNVYEPIQNVPFEYEHWCKQEKFFQKCTFFTIGLSLITLFVILMLRDIVLLCFMNALTISNMVLLALSLYMFSKLMNLARVIFR